MTAFDFSPGLIGCWQQTKYALLLRKSAQNVEGMQACKNSCSTFFDDNRRQKIEWPNIALCNAGKIGLKSNPRYKLPLREYW